MGRNETVSTTTMCRVIDALVAEGYLAEGDQEGAYSVFSRTLNRNHVRVNRENRTQKNPFKNEDQKRYVDEYIEYIKSAPRNDDELGRWKSSRGIPLNTFTYWVRKFYGVGYLTEVQKKHSMQAYVLKAVRDNPGITRLELSQIFDCSMGRIEYTTLRLTKSGDLRVERKSAVHPGRYYVTGIEPETVHGA